MGLVSITVTGIYTDATGGLLPDKVIRFRSIGVFGDDGAVVATTEIRVTTDPVTAEFEVELLTSNVAEAYVRYQVVFHNGSRRKIDLTDDAPTISLEDLINAYDPTYNPSSSGEWLNHEARIDALELAGPGGGAAVSWSAGTLSGTRASIVFSDSNGINFGLNGSTITASHNGLTDSSPFRLTADNSQLQFTSANSLFRHTSADSQLRFTSADSQLQFTSANSNFLGTAATQSFRHTSADSQLQFTSANSNLLGTGATASFRFTSQNSQLRFTSADTQLRFTSADTQLRFTSADTQLQFTSANTKFVQEWMLTGNTAGTSSSVQGSRLHFSGGNNITLSGSSNSIVIHGATAGGGAALSVSAGTLSGTRASLVFSDSNGINFGMDGSTITASHNGLTDAGAFLGTAATQSFRFTSQNSQLQFTSANSNFLGTAATQSFRHTSADTQLQFTSANTKFVQEWALTGNTAGTTSSAQGSRMYFSGGAMLTISGSSNSLVFSVNSASLLGTGATASFRHTSADTQLRFTSADTQLQFTSANSNFLGTAATQSFRHTSADTQLQFTSANTKFAQEWHLTGNTAGTSSSVQGSRWYFSGGANMTISGSSNSLVFSAGSAAPSPVNFSAGTTSGNLGSVVFSNSNLVSFGINGSTITGSVPATSSLSGTGIVSISANASTISIGAKYPDIQYFEPQDLQGMGLMTNITGISSRPFFSPFILPGNLTNSSLVLQMSRSTSGSNAFTVQAGIYTYVNQTSISLLGSLSNVFSGGNTASFSGVRQFLLTGWGTAVTNLTAGAYVLGLNFFAAATASMNYSLFGAQSASSPLGYVSAGTENNNTTNTTFGAPYAFGRYTAQSGALPNAVAQSHLTGGINGASLPIAPWFIMMP